jgi:hypothetical protein
MNNQVMKEIPEEILRAANATWETRGNVRRDDRREPLMVDGRVVALRDAT